MNTAIISTIIAGAALLLSIYNASKKDVKEIARMMIKLDSISEDIKEMKKDLSDMRLQIQDNHDRVLKLEMFMEQARTDIDKLKGGTKFE